MNMLIAGRQLPVERLLELQERLARHHQVRKADWPVLSLRCVKTCFLSLIFGFGEEGRVTGPGDKNNFIG